jgi:hypothetical protein
MRNVFFRRKSGNHAILVARIIQSATLWLGCLICPGAYGNPTEEICFQPGVMNSPTRPMTAGQLRVLAAGIRHWTGFAEVHFDRQGRLRIGDRARLVGGSAAARALVVAAVESGDAFRLEDHNRSMAVAFASLQPVEYYIDRAAVRHTVWNLKLDFHDLCQLRGSSEGVAAFDPAISLLHELGHGVLHLEDAASGLDPLGDCERYMNRIRREAGHAERQSYLPQYRLGSTPDHPAESLLAQLVFVKRSPNDKAKTTLVFFRIESVCAPDGAECGQRNAGRL